MSQVLIVDDDPVIHRLISPALQVLGCETFSAFNGGEAEPIALARQLDLILLDIMMPQQDGYITCQHLRQQGYKGTITMMSALNETTGTKRAMQCGANSYLLKPFDRFVLGLHLEYAVWGMQFPTMTEWMDARK